VATRHKPNNEGRRQRFEEGRRKTVAATYGICRGGRVFKI